MSQFVKIMWLWPAGDAAEDQDQRKSLKHLLFFQSKFTAVQFKISE